MFVFIFEFGDKILEFSISPLFDDILNKKIRNVSIWMNFLISGILNHTILKGLHYWIPRQFKNEGFFVFSKIFFNTFFPYKKVQITIQI